MVPYDDLRKGRYSEVDRAYFITTVLADREKCYFDDFVCARLVIMNMKFLHEDQAVYSLAWVVMPDHVHWLFQLRATSSLSEVVKKPLKLGPHTVLIHIWVKAGRFGKKVSMIMRYGKKRIFELLLDILWQILYVRVWWSISVIILIGMQYGCRCGFIRTVRMNSHLHMNLMDECCALF
jgi:REP element-mobilizing transposase RayT